MKILVTGGAGFIGSHLVKALYEQGHDVVVVDNLNDSYNIQLKKDRLEKFLEKEQFVFCMVDITNKQEMEVIFDSFQFDVIVHLAAHSNLRLSLKDPYIYYHNNVFATLNLLELARKYQTGKFLMASSSSVYGDVKDLPHVEDKTLGELQNPYARTKRINELKCFDYHKAYKIPIGLFRFFNIYGPWGRPDAAYYKFCSLIVKDKPIDVYNFGKMQRDYTYISDVVTAIISAVDKNFKYEIFNIGNDSPEMLDDVISLIEDYLGITAKKNYMPMQPGDVPASHANIDKARALLDFNPKTKIEDGLKKFVDWFREYHK